MDLISQFLRKTGRERAGQKKCEQKGKQSEKKTEEIEK